ncbi:MAG: DUF2325 domain-containing protein [Pseudomonadota bacterium]
MQIVRNVPLQDMANALQDAARDYANGRRKRLRIWELDHKFHCSIVGTCINNNELRQLSRRLRGGRDASQTEYALHGAFVSLAGAGGAGARMLQKLLDKKYAGAISRFRALNDAKERECAWQDAVADLSVAGIYWALLTAPESEQSLVERAYGDVHMLSHLSSQSREIQHRQMVDLKQQLKQQQSRHAAAELRSKTRLEQCQKRQSELEHKVAALQKELQETRKSANRANGKKSKAEPARAKPSPKPVETAVDTRDEPSRDERKASWQESQLQLWRERAETSQKDLESALQERDALAEALAVALQNQADDDADADSVCPQSSLHGRCLLFIGGRDRQAQHFRALIEHRDGVFLHHDGGLADGKAHLESMLARADAVFCPLDCVSHAAMQRARQHCKRNQKMMVMLRNASLAAFAQATDDLVKSSPDQDEADALSGVGMMGRMSSDAPALS